MNATEPEWDVVVIGGGPAGSTCATLLRKYQPDTRVLVVEKAVFPREHVGESQLPACAQVVHEMGAWDKVEAAGFPIKLGASLTWGRDKERWDFDFYPVERFVDEPRPGRFEGQRARTAFQVERSIYDEILLDHAEENGTTVRQGVAVTRVRTDGDRIEGLELSDGTTVTARHYVDASGAPAVLRKAMGVESQAPESLRNVAFWAYWDDAAWAVEIGVGGTRVQIRSLPWGWLWFIPLGPTRASVGLVVPSKHYKSTGLSPEAIYTQAIAEQPEVAGLLADAERTSAVLGTRDWSHVADRVVGENWWVCGEAAGFADPILAAGMSLAHTSARELAFSILEADRGEQDATWVRNVYDRKTRKNIRQHIRFAQFWYASNGCFEDLQDHCQDIAKEAGLHLSPEESWRWLAQGGFTNQQVRAAKVGSFDLGTARQLVGKFSEDQADLTTQAFTFMKANKLTLDIRGARKHREAEYHEGRVMAVPCLKRGAKVLPMVDQYAILVESLKTVDHPVHVFQGVQQIVAQKLPPHEVGAFMNRLAQTLEVMVLDGWVKAEFDPRRPAAQWTLGKNAQLRASTEGEAAYKAARGEG